MVNKKCLLTFGTRPEAIKMAPIVKHMQQTKGLDVKICITAQHRGMLDQVLSLFDINPDYDLNLMKPNQDLYDITSGVLLGLRNIFSKWRPDVVIVHGDTTTTFAATLASFYEKIRVGHVEAGLRTGDIYSPWPEEANRKLASTLCHWHFAPTKRAKENLIREHINKQHIYLTGNTVVDSVNYVTSKILNDNPTNGFNTKRFAFINQWENMVLVTAHRRENFGTGIINICKSIKKISKTHPKTLFIYPVHPNPMVKAPAQEILGGLMNVKLCDPLDYFDFIYLMSKCKFIITDSGGIQEEAVTLSKHVLLMREHTERQESVELGLVTLVGSTIEKIAENANNLLNTPAHTLQKFKNPYGDGTASQRITDIILES